MAPAASSETAFASITLIFWRNGVSGGAKGDQTVLISLDELAAHPAARSGFVLDLRPGSAFETGHLAGSVNLPVSREALETGEGDLDAALPSIFLPARHEPLLIVGDGAGLALRLAELLADRGRPRVDAAELPQPGEPLPPGLSWARGASRETLWRPPDYLARHFGLLPPPAAGPVLDLACGSGRACVWLAERGYRVTGVDHQPEALELGRRLAADRNVSCRFVAADLRRPPAGLEGPWAVVLDFRYLERDLLAAAPWWLAPGGVMMMRTFRDAPGYEGHPHPRHRLWRGELAHAFPAAHFEVLAHEETHDPDGRPAAGVVARRRIALPRRPR